MEIKRKEKTLFGLFLKYVTLFCVNTILLAAGVFGLMLWAAWAGLLLPANYAEVQLSENAGEIYRAGDLLETWIPQGCTYGVYGPGGEWQEGNFPRQEQKKAWDHYEKNHIYAEYKGFYRFLPLEDGNICIVKYYLVMRYAGDMLNKLFPSPEILMPIADLVLFVLNAVLLSRSFAKKVGEELQALQGITERIAANDLEFETGTSDVREIEGIMSSLGRMKDALQESLRAQWDMEKQKHEQLSALAHDIKTPLTIIRGNAELLKESGLSQEDQECVRYILDSGEEIQGYLEAMKEVMGGPGQGKERATVQTEISCESLGEELEKMARQIAGAQRVPAVFGNGMSEGERCGEGDDEEDSEREAYKEGAVRCSLPDILRAWSNLVSNGAEHTDPQRGIEISAQVRRREGQSYFRAAVRDYGPGFSPRDLQYADQEFYSGDASRHDRKHSGLGLSIAKKFAGEQGGFLEYGNREDKAGAEAALWLLAEGKQVDGGT